jgi:uncharacterized membrane-anchored protein
VRSSRPLPSRVGRRVRREPLAAKVPEISALFWVIKLLTTGMGESFSDYLGNGNLVVAGLVLVVGFGFALWLQFRVRRYIAPVYWFAVMMVAVFGTAAADLLHVVGHIPYLASTAFYAVVLTVVLVLWRRSEGTLSIHSITTRRRETFYWCTVLATFALGTATGDLTATVLGLGFAPSAVLFAVLILVPLVAWRRGMNEVGAFWFAYILTRPLGASLADWLGKPPAITGVGLGDGTVSGVATMMIAVLVACLAITRRDIQPPQDAMSPALPGRAGAGPRHPTLLPGSAEPTRIGPWPPPR